MKYRQPSSQYIVICAACQRLRDKNGLWYQTESSIVKMPQTKITHTICPTCGPKWYPDFWPRAAI